MWRWMLASPSQTKQCTVILSPYYLGINILLGVLGEDLHYVEEVGDKYSGW